MCIRDSNILGEGMVDVELDPKHYNQAIDLSLDKYRQKSSQSTEESYIFLEIKTDVGEYTLPEEVIEVISKGAAQSWQMENRWATMSQDHYDHGFAVDHMRKDLKIAIQEAEKQGASLEITKLIDSFYEDIQKMGGSRWDTSSLLKRLQNND